MSSDGTEASGHGRTLGLFVGTSLALAGLAVGSSRCGAGPFLAERETAVVEPATKVKPANPASKKATAADLPSGPTRITLTSSANASHTTMRPDFSKKSIAPPPAPDSAPLDEPIARALRTVKDCQSSYAEVRDYTCTFYKRELVKGQMTPLFVMAMKARANPRSIYFKFHEPYRGREAIYVDGRNSGKVLAHDVGFTRLLAGTMELEPTSARAMEQNRHPITHAGIGALIDTVARRWAVELRPDEAILLFEPEMMFGNRRCLMIESIHPRREPEFHFHKVRLFIDAELNLPIRFEGYDWPREEGGSPELLEEYSYINLKLNVGLGDIDFDIANRQYSFGRF